MIKKNNTLKLGSRIISEESLPYIIAEIGVNHEGSLKKAEELILLAKEGGADAAKHTQTVRIRQYVGTVSLSDRKN